MLIHRSFFLLFIFLYSLDANGQEVSIKDGSDKKGSNQEMVDSSLWELVIPLEISDERKKKGTIVSLSRKDFINMPASFDDPSRLLINYAGFANSNDQNNGIIYHGMPSHFSGWQVNGAEIVNPNHLRTAGIRGNQVALSSGGVNAYSGQVIGDYQFRGSPDIYTQNNYLAGVSDISLRTPYKNQMTLNASLIGMEIGLDSKKGNFSSLANYRYSTVGLLSQAGLDFGGEEIIYQDAVIKLQHDSIAGGKGTFYAIYGRNSNFKEDPMIPNNEATSIEDVEFQDIKGDLFISGISYDKEVDQLLFQTAVNYSFNKTEGEVLFGNIYEDQQLISYNTSLTYSKNNHQIELALKGSWFARDFLPANSGNRTFTKKTTFQEGLVYKYNPNRRVYFTLGVFTPEYSTTGTFAPIFSEKDTTTTKILPKLGVTWINSSYRCQIDGKYSQNAQFYNIPDGSSIYPQYVLPHSHNFTLDLKDNKIGLNVQFFYHHINGLITGSIFNAFSSLDEAGFQNFDVFGQFNTDSTAKIYGISLSFAEKLSQNSRISGNVSYSDGKQSGFDNTPLTEQNIPHVSSFTSNFHYKKQDLFSKNLDLQFGLHYRQGKYAPSIFVRNYTTRLPYYFRADLRLNYHFRKNKSKFKSMLSLDIQNLTNRLNASHYFYDYILQEEVLETQLGIIPVLSWRVVI